MSVEAPVQAGDAIVELDSGKKLTVEGLWGHASKVIDFSANYQKRIGVDPYGNPLYTGRGFRFADEGTVWAKDETEGVAQ